MANRKTTLFYALLIAVASLAVGMVMASRLGLAPQSGAQTIAAPPMNSAPITGPLTASTFRDIAKAVTPAVVNIRTESRQRTQDLTEFFGGDDLLNRFFGSPGQGGQGGQGRRAPREQIAVAAGTGFIIDKLGFIITNNHVVEGANKIQVSLYGDDDGQTYGARIVGRDPLTDSALIELTEKPGHTLPEIKFGDSAQVQPGDFVMAIGNPFGLAHTVSVGVISANRPSGLPVATGRWADVLQTDAAINPGNSGGPLLNVRGEVVGMNTAIYTDQRQGNIGIGFAMPINVVRDLLPQLRTGKITRGRIGVTVGAVPVDALDEFGLKERKGAMVATVDRSGPAAAAGLEPGDVIIEFNGKPVKNNSDLVGMVVNTRPGSTVPVKVLRDKQERTLSIKVDELNLEEEGSSTSRRSGGSDEEEASSGYGMTLNNITPELARRLRLDDDIRGAVITDVEQGSPAARAGLSPGDVITRVNRRPVTSAAETRRELSSVESGGTAFLIVLRGGQETFVTVTKE